MNSINTNKSVSVTDSGNSHSLPALPPKEALSLPVPLNELTLEAEAAQIKSFYDKIEKKNCNLTEIKTADWAQLGQLLINHRKHVEAEGFIWTPYAVEEFPWLKERRRQQCMALAGWGDIVKPYYHMGLDRIYYLFNKLIHYHSDPDFDYIRSRYAYIFDPAMTSLPEKEDVKVKADVIRNGLKFKHQVKRNDYDKDLVFDALEAGCTFGKKDYEYLNQPSVTPDDIDLYLLKMMVTAGSPASHKSSSSSRISIQNILSMLLQTVQGYNAEDTMPEYLNPKLLDTVIGELTTLRDRMDNASDDKGVPNGY